MSRVLDGLKRAAVVFYASAEVGRAINAAGICTADRLVYAPYGVAAEFLEKGDDIAPPLPSGPPYLLHVGSCIDRKRVDVLLDVYANLRPGRRLRLVQIGGVWTPAQVEQITRLGIENDVVQLRGLTRRQLAAIYRDAALVLQPSDAEGYGLPVVEALACGANVVVSDIPVLREVGGDVVSFAPVADIAAWNDIASRLLDAPETAPSLEVRRAWAAKFTWEAQARTIAEAYRKLLGG
ncbi:MAG: glycosyltransferase [Planctomycetaceae bacterium]|nr:glycosyltransferase [Planctomycetaceae bacterium]